MECTFQVGDRVVCIDAHDTHSWGIAELAEGTIYTVAAVEMVNNTDGPYATEGVAHAGLRLREVRRRHSVIQCFAAARFRPVKPLSFWIGEKQKVRA